MDISMHGNDDNDRSSKAADGRIAMIFIFSKSLGVDCRGQCGWGGV